MSVLKWSAAAVTLLMGLANLGQVSQSTTAAWNVLGLVLGASALLAVIGLIAHRSWGATAAIAVGAANLVASIVGAFTGLDGWMIGAVLSALGVVLGAVYAPASRSAVAA